jgi:hypothetical protein
MTSPFFSKIANRFLFDPNPNFSVCM